MKKNLPWFRTAADGTIDIQYAPRSGALTEMFVGAANVNTMEAVLFEPNLLKAEELFYKIRDAYRAYSDGGDDFLKLEFSQFFEWATGFRLDEVSYTNGSTRV